MQKKNVDVTKTMAVNKTRKAVFVIPNDHPDFDRIMDHIYHLRYKRLIHASDENNIYGFIDFSYPRSHRSITNKIPVPIWDFISEKLRQDTLELIDSLGDIEESGNLEGSELKWLTVEETRERRNRLWREKRREKLSHRQVEDLEVKEKEQEELKNVQEKTRAYFTKEIDVKSIKALKVKYGTDAMWK